MGTITAILRVLTNIQSWFSGKRLKDGEFAYEKDKKGVKIGDGTTSYGSLPYLIPPRDGVDNKYLRCVGGEVEWSDVEESSYPPSGGVPYNDLSSGVQASLDKADTALQSETDPTVPSWAKQSSKPTYDYSEIENTPTIPTVNDATLKIQRNGTDLDTFTANASQNKTINIVVPTTASDVSALPSSTKYGAYFSLSINSSTYVITAQLKDQDGNNLGSAQTIDLPLESVVVNGSYDDATKKIILTLQNGNTIEFSVADLVNGLQTEITADNPLSADLVADGTTNKVYTATEQSKLSGIESGAEVNVQSDWNQSDNTADDYIKNKPTVPAAVSGTHDGTNWTSLTIGAVTKGIPSGGGGGLTNYDFTHIANATVSTSTTTVTFAQNQRCSQMITVSADIGVAIVCNNSSDNYIWIKNAGASDVDVTISSITYNNSAIAAANIHIAGGTMSIEAGKILEVGIVCNADGAFITSRNDL